MNLEERIELINKIFEDNGLDAQPYKDTCLEILNNFEHQSPITPSEDYTKDFKYTLKSKKGKVILQSIVSFGSKDKPFPKDWENDSYINMILQEYKNKFIDTNFDVEVDDNLDFDI